MVRSTGPVGLSATLVALALALGWPATARAACGAPDDPCQIDGGIYYVALPDAPAGAPVVLWLHGYASSGRSAVANGSFARRLTEAGFALVAPDGQPFLSGSGKLDWGVDDGQDWARDDVAFLRAVKADAVARFGLDEGRVLAAGFSRGGSMIWDLACAAPDTALAFAAVAGAFWEPIAGTCAAPVHLHHTHGFKDRLVPFEGRQVTFQGFDFWQGNVMKGLDTWRQVNGCMGSATEIDFSDERWVKRWSDCRAGSLTLTLTTGGHGIPRGWSDEVLAWFAEIERGH